MVQTLASRDARLITTEGSDATDGAVEVAHEALIRGWTRLRQWVDAERTGLRIQRRLTEAAQEWAEARPEAKKDFLYSGARLAVCREWVETHRDELSSIEATFLAASEEAEQDELENERRLREDAEAAAKRQSELGRRSLVAALVAGVLALTSGGLALWATRRPPGGSQERAKRPTGARRRPSPKPSARTKRPAWRRLGPRSRNRGGWLHSRIR